MIIHLLLIGLGALKCPCNAWSIKDWIGKLRHFKLHRSNNFGAQYVWGLKGSIGSTAPGLAEIQLLHCFQRFVDEAHCLHDFSFHCLLDIFIPGRTDVDIGSIVLDHKHSKPKHRETNIVNFDDLYAMHGLFSSFLPSDQCYALQCIVKSLESKQRELCQVNVLGVIDLLARILASLAAGIEWPAKCYRLMIMIMIYYIFTKHPKKLAIDIYIYMFWTWRHQFFLWEPFPPFFRELCLTCPLVPSSFSWPVWPVWWQFSWGGPIKLEGHQIYLNVDSNPFLPMGPNWILFTPKKCCNRTIQKN